MKLNRHGQLNRGFQDSSFPEKNWNDFILKILHWWLEALKNLAKDKKTEFHFMDGPFE